MNELHLLRALLVFGCCLAPLGTDRFLLLQPKTFAWVHALAVVCVVLALFGSMPALSLGWFVYRVLILALYLRQKRAALPSLASFVTLVPLLFSIIAAGWLVGGCCALHLLGYGEAFSYYAALHGTFLGWIFVGAIAILAQEVSPQRFIYQVAVFGCLVSFLLIAFGIDGVARLKPWGVAGLSFLIPVVQLTFLRSVWRTHRIALGLGALSLGALVLTMLLAWQNELGTLTWPGFLRIRAMSSIHGFLNAVVTAPCFLLAVLLERRRRNRGMPLEDRLSAK